MLSAWAILTANAGALFTRANLPEIGYGVGTDAGAPRMITSFLKVWK